MTIYNLINELIVIEVSGYDSKKYLQGQLTNDINVLDEKPFQFSAHLNNKGRMLASFIITKPYPDKYYLITTSEIADTLIPRLSMFILRSKVTLNKQDTNIIYSNHPINNEQSIEIYPQHFISIINNTSNEIIADEIPWKNCIITHGFPLIYTTTQGKFIPQQINFDLLNGVNFKKGCYTGQEIVARTHYLGKIKRRMFYFTSRAPTLIGQKIISPTMDNQEVGIIVDTVKCEGYYSGLASIQIDCTDTAFLDIEHTFQVLTKPISY